MANDLVLVPREATEEMLDAAFAATVWPDLNRATSSDVMNALRENMRKEYRAMIAAAPQTADQRLHRAANEVNDRLAAAAAEAPGCKHPWTGPGEQPAKFWCKCGTLIYRSYADYCDG